MKKFRVLLVTHLGDVGGTELSTLSLATGLKQAGHDVYVMCNTHPLVSRFAERGISVVLAGMRRNIWGLVKDASIMRRCIAENKIEVIHFQSALPIIMSVLSWRAIKRDKVKLVWTCRGIRRMNYAVVGHLFNHLIDFVIANCDAERDRLIRHGLSPRKVITIYNCPNIAVPMDIGGKSKDLLNELSIDADIPIVGTASRLAPERGVKYFLEAAAMVSRQSPNAKFVIAGGGLLEDELRQQARELGVEQQMVFLGRRRDMENVYSILDVFVNPALVRCGTDNVNIEAMAFAKPIVATNVGGGPEIVRDGVTGMLVPPRDSKALAEATLRLLGDMDVARQMGLAGRERVMRDFSTERLVREVEAVYERLLAVGPASARTV